MIEKQNILKQIEEYAAVNKVPIIQKEAAEHLINFIKNKRPKKVLEIGTAIGYSAILMALHLPRDAKIITIEKDIARVNQATLFIAKTEITNKIEIKTGDADTIIPSLNTSFDFVFIDAAKGQYLNHLKKIIPHLEDYAIIVADNVLFRGLILDKPESEEAPKKYRTIVRRLKEYISFVTSDKHFKTEIIEKSDGLAVSYYKKEG